MPRSSSERWALPSSRMRIVAPSPREVGRVVTRRSMRRSSTETLTRPSCGTRFSAMSSSLMIFSREITALIIRFGTWADSFSTPSTRKRIRSSPSSGSRWMSEAPSPTAWARML